MTWLKPYYLWGYFLLGVVIDRVLHFLGSSHYGLMRVALVAALVLYVLLSWWIHRLENK
jgi:peptidoglycan/LPS O-acetylase OafA/YrhL